MTGQIIAFPNSAAQPVQHKPLYSMEWVTETGEKLFKNTTDEDAIRRQLSSCLRRQLFAVVRLPDGSSCGGVIARTELNGRIFVAHFLDVSWGA